MNGYKYGVIGNCKTAALVSQKGSIDWLCIPNFDSPSIFTLLLDKDKGGCFAIETGEEYEVNQQYVKNTNILLTRFTAPEGSFEVIDFMPRYRTYENEHFLPAELYRYIRHRSGKPKLRIKYDPVMNYASEKAVHKKLPYFIKTFSSVNERDDFYLYSSLDFDDILENREFTIDRDQYLLLSYTQKLIPIDADRVYLEYQRTKVYWMNWHYRSKKLSHYNDFVSRSLLVLKLMSYHDTGAVLAAVTTSLPEVLGETRNWDYRYCWLRDASMSIKTLVKMGHQSAARRFLGFIKNILQTKHDSFQIMYGIHGERILTEKELDYLAGYENSQPVRTGNAAYNQRQNDSLGYLLDVVLQYYKHFPGTLDEVEEMWETVKGIVCTVFTEWHNPDQSIWEFRNRQQHFVFSKVMSWVALDRAIQIAQRLDKKYHVTRWTLEAANIKEDIYMHGWNEELQSFTQSYSNEDMDSSLLLMEYYGFIEAKDPKYISTVHRIKQELCRDGLMYRYKAEDDFGLTSSSFMICNFWMIRALKQIGEEKEALKMFHNLLQYSNHVGLFSEDIDFVTKRQLGNFPQAYSHLALIDTALLFADPVHVSEFIRP